MVYTETRPTPTGVEPPQLPCARSHFFSSVNNQCRITFTSLLGVECQRDSLHFDGPSADLIDVG
jgi:hypothetical protein